MAEITLIDAIRQAMDEEMARDENVFIVGEDVGQRGGVFRATIGLYDKYGGDRVIDSPLAELSIVGVGIGAALYGMRPICEIQFADFIYPAFNQIVSEAAKMCYRSNGEWTVPMVIRAPYGGGIGGGLYHSQSVEGFFAHIPGSESGDPFQSVRRQRAAEVRGARSQPGDFPGAEERLPLDPRRSAGR